jgi:hypothetical protein
MPSDNASNQSDTESESPGMVDVMHESTTEKSRGNVAYRPDKGCLETDAV